MTPKCGQGWLTLQDLFLPADFCWLHLSEALCGLWLHHTSLHPYGFGPLLFIIIIIIKINKTAFGFGLILI